MPNPTMGELHTNAPLTNVSIAHTQSAERFVAGRVFPRVPVMKESDTYYIYDIGDSYRREAAKRARGTEAKVVGWRTSTDSYTCDEWALAQDIDDLDRANADSVFSLDRDVTQHLTHMMLLEEENEWITNFFTTSLWTGSTTGSDITPGNLWSAVDSTPIEDVRAQYVAVTKASGGYRPNTMVVGPEVWQQLVDHPDILERVKYMRGVESPAQIQESDLASLFSVQRFLVAWGVQNTAVEGVASPSTFTDAFLAGKHALLCYSAPVAGLRQPSAGYTFVWTGLHPSGQRIEKMRIQEKWSDRIAIRSAYDQKLTGATLGAFFSSVVS